MEQLISFISRLNPIEMEAKKSLAKIIESKSIKKGSYVISPNTYCNDLFFIKKGIVKMQFNSNGGEFIMRFFEENIIFTDLESVNTHKRSKYEVLALEDSELIIIPFNEFEKLCLKHLSLETFHRKFLTLAHLNMMDRIREMLEENAKKRYENFIKSYPSLVQRIHLRDLAKYIGITQVSLSRIRASK